MVSPGPWMVPSERSCTTTKAIPKKAPARSPSAEFNTDARLVGTCWRFGGINHADIARAQCGGHSGFLNVVKHGVVKLAVRVHFALENIVVRHLGCLLGHQTGLGSIVRSEQMLAALGGLKFVSDSLDDVGAFLYRGPIPELSPELGPSSRPGGPGSGKTKFRQAGGEDR